MFILLKLFYILIYVGHLESKERLRIQPAELFNLAHVVCSVECGQLPGAVRAANFSTL